MRLGTWTLYSLQRSRITDQARNARQEDAVVAFGWLSVPRYRRGAEGTDPTRSHGVTEHPTVVSEWGRPCGPAYGSSAPSKSQARLVSVCRACDFRARSIRRRATRGPLAAQ